VSASLRTEQRWRERRRALFALARRKGMTHDQAHAWCDERISVAGRCWIKVCPVCRETFRATRSSAIYCPAPATCRRVGLRRRRPQEPRR